MLTSHRRCWIILALGFCAIVLNYFDRQIVSILKPALKIEFCLDDAGYAVLANIFTDCYATMYPVAGWLAMGEAAGRAAKMAVREGIPPSAINVQKLREELLTHGAYLRI